MLNGLKELNGVLSMANRNKLDKKFNKIYRTYEDLDSVDIEPLTPKQKVKHFRKIAKALTKITASRDFIVRYACLRELTMYSGDIEMSPKEHYQELYDSYHYQLSRKIRIAQNTANFFKLM